MDIAEFCDCQECTTGQPPRSLLARGWFWFGAACSLAFWSFLYLVVSWAAR